MKRLASISIAIAFLILVKPATAEVIDFTVDPNQSTVNILLLGNSDDSSISGTGQIDLIPPSEPFGTAQIVALNLILDDGFFLSVFGGLVTLSADPGVVSMTMSQAGPAGNVDQNNQFQQPGNLASMAGEVDVWDPLNLFIGTGTYNLADNEDAPFDISDAQLTLNGNELTISVDFIVVQEVSPGVELTVSGTLVATGTVPTTVGADTANVILGSVTQGSVADTVDSDDVHFCIFRGNPFGITLPSIIIDFEGTLTTDSPSTLTLVVESNSTNNDIDQEISAFNYDTGQWELLDTTEATFNVDQTISIDVTSDVLRFVEMGTGKVKMRVTYTQGPASIFLAWSACIDQIGWTFNE